MIKHGSIAAAAIALVAALSTGSAAEAATKSVYDGDVRCAVEPGNGGIRLCRGATSTWDGKTKIDVNVILPPAPDSGPDGPYPTIGIFHGWGGKKIGVTDRTQAWAERGYVVFSMSDRGWGHSCGALDADRLTPACAEGYNHLMDTRYEVRDAQYLLSVLADEGLVAPRKIGATGASYGGGMSMSLAALRDRVMLPDGSLVPWTSPQGTQMAIAAAVPQWPWTDLAYSLLPNGTTLDYVADAPYFGPDGDAPFGVEKQSWVATLYRSGQLLSNYALPGADPGSDLVTWFNVITAGEPYDPAVTVPMVNEITAHHSSYYIDHGQPPAPLLIQSGWNDDLFPVDEALRFYNRTRTQFPGDPISLLLMDDGHPRSQNKEEDEEFFEGRADAWLDYYLKGIGPEPGSGVEALTTACDEPSAGPFDARSWKAIAPGEIRIEHRAAKTIAPDAHDPAGARAFGSVANDACSSASGRDVDGAATYRLSEVSGGGFTLIGSPTIVADISTPVPESELAARLVDIAPSGEKTLVARGLMRVGDGGKGVVFQLHPQAYRFEDGHIAQLELLPSDAPYARASDLQGAIRVSRLEVRLPVREQPGALEGLVKAPASKPLPPGYEPARGYANETRSNE